MFIEGSDGRKVKLDQSPFAYNPFRPRLDHIRQLIFFSDYMGAERVLIPLITDVRDCVDNKFSLCQQSECVEFISLTLYTFFKLRRHHDILDFVESFYVNTGIVETCNPFSLYYIVESFRNDQKLADLFQFETPLFKDLRKRFTMAREQVRCKWLDNPNCLLHDGSEIEWRITS